MRKTELNETDYVTRGKMESEVTTHKINTIMAIYVLSKTYRWVRNFTHTTNHD